MNIVKLSFFSVLLLSISFCGHKKAEFIAEHEFFNADYSMHGLPMSTNYSAGENRGILNNHDIDEASGLAVSRINHQYLYTHNDHGDIARFFLIDNNAQHKVEILLENAQNRDWEDICIGPGPQANTNYLYIGDIGDNQARYNIKNIYRFPEPNISTWIENQQSQATVSDYETISFVYPDGKKDAESLLIDPYTKDLYIVTKREFPVTIYRLAFPQSTSEVITAEKFCTLPFQWAVAGDISADGTKIVLKTYFDNFLWTRESNETMAEAFKRAPIRIPLEDELQGESFAWCHITGRYYTISEKSSGDQMPPLFKYSPVN
jgi:hypothetical protein